MKQLIYVEWQDAIQLEGMNVGANPVSATFKGYTTLIEETGEDIVVAQFLTEDGAYFDRVAIPRKAIVKLDFITEIKRKGSE